MTPAVFCAILYIWGDCMNLKVGDRAIYRGNSVLNNKTGIIKCISGYNIAFEFDEMVRGLHGCGGRTAINRGYWVSVNHLLKTDNEIELI